MTRNRDKSHEAQVDGQPDAARSVGAGSDGPTNPLPASAILVESEVVALALVGDGKLLFANAAFRRLFKLAQGVTDSPIINLLERLDRERVGDAFDSAGSLPASCVAIGLRGDGSHIDVELRFSKVAYRGATLLALFAENLAHRLRATTQLSLLAYSDPLTGLANRALFADRLRQSVIEVRHSGKSFAVLALDLDGFKQINDQRGHDAGDGVLQRIAQRLLACVRETDTVARSGGDEFAVILSNAATHADVESTSERIISAVRQPIGLGQFEVGVNVSIGIAIFPEHANDVDNLLSAADHALYAAKRQGGNRFVWAVEPSLADSTPLPLVWTVAHEVGVAEIDEQHEKLAMLLNELGHALRNAEPHTAILDEVIQYTAFHFASEERLMRECGYGGEDVHRDLHRQLLNDVRGLKLDGERVSVSLILRFLQEWLVRHVDGADRDLANALLARRGTISID